MRSATSDSIALSSVRAEPPTCEQHVGHEQAEQDRDRRPARRSRASSAAKKTAAGWRPPRRPGERSAGPPGGRAAPARPSGPPLATGGLRLPFDSLRARTGTPIDRLPAPGSYPCRSSSLVIARSCSPERRGRAGRVALSRSGAASVRRRPAAPRARRAPGSGGGDRPGADARARRARGRRPRARRARLPRPRRPGRDRPRRRRARTGATGTRPAFTDGRARAPSRSSGEPTIVAVLAVVLAVGRDGAHAEPLGRAVPARRRRRQRHPDDVDQGPRRPRPARS